MCQSHEHRFPKVPEKWTDCLRSQFRVSHGYMGGFPTLPCRVLQSGHGFSGNVSCSPRCSAKWRFPGESVVLGQLLRTETDGDTSGQIVFDVMKSVFDVRTDFSDLWRWGEGGYLVMSWSFVDVIFRCYGACLMSGRLFSRPPECGRPVQPPSGPSNPPNPFRNLSRCSRPGT